MKRSVKDSQRKQSQKDGEKENDHIIVEKVYKCDDLQEPVEIRVVRQSMKIFGGAVIRRFFIKRGRVEQEIVKCFDCPLHLTTKNCDENYCVLPVGALIIEPKFLKTSGQMQVCTHVCAFKKEQYRKWMDYIEQWGHSIPEEEKRRMMEYLSAPFTRHGDDFTLPSEKELGLCE